MENVVEAYKVFLETEELGATDTRRLNLVINKLDNENKILKDDVILLVAKHSKDKDGAYRNFVSRLENAINVAKEEVNEEIQEVLNTLHLEKIKINNNQYLKFHGNVPKRLNTVIPNLNYSEENYIEALGTNPKLNIFISYAAKDEKDVSVFKTTLQEIANDKIITWTMNKLIHGISFDTQIKKELDKCDYGFAMLSGNFLDSEYITDIEVKKLLEDNKIFPILLSGSFSELNKLCEKDIQKQLLEKHTFSLKDRGRSDSFSAMVSDQSREYFVNEVIKALYNRKDYDLEQENISRNNHQCYINSRKEYNKTLYTDSYCKPQEIMTALESIAVNEEVLEKKINLLDDMLAWSTEKNSPIYALLGEYGVGKTFNTRMFASKLEELRQTNKDLPYPLYIDLRDTPTFIESNGSKRQVTVEEIIVEILRLSNNKAFSAEKIIEDNKKGKAILIFDGLDEKLVHYPKDMKNKFLRELINVLDVNNFVKTNQKILLSCRTHYFESIKEQNSFLRDNERFDVGKTNYHATEVLPFNMEQIQNYIKKVFPIEETEKIFTFISSDNYLKTIVTKPLMLNKLSAILPKLIEHKSKNKKITSKVFYQSLIDDTFSRDNEKHTINIRDKKRLLKEVSYMFYKKGIQSISIDKLNDWFNEYIYEQPIFKKYQEKDFDILELDLRNSSLLVRFGDTNFGFSHSSFYEYFIAEYLFENWENFDFSGKLSELTFEFIKDTINGLDSHEKSEFIKKFKNTLSKDTRENKKFQLDLLKELKIGVENIILDSQELEYYTMKDIHCNNLEVRNSNLFSSNLIDCTIDSLNVTNSNFNDSYIKNCKIAKIAKDEKSVMDYITDFDNIIDNDDLKLKELHNFKSNINININKINISSGLVNSIAEDENNIYLGCSDGLKIYTKENFSCIKEIASGSVQSIAEDENNIYLGCSDGLKIYTKENFSCIKEIASDWLQSIAEDENNIYLGCSDGLKIYTKENFSCIKEIASGLVNSIAEDENNIYLGCSDGLKIYTKENFSCIKEIASDWLQSIAEDENNIYLGCS
ncbi:MAG: TIR domain-containing protein, partial [Arcobacteraceae bacterium]|nr:TIR domain-containing protein [Arcobacteraceae bacterium]